MPQITESISVQVPVSVAYDQWTRFESFPHFLSYIESVTEISDTLTRWKFRVAGVEREFDAEIVEQFPDERISWRTTGGQELHVGEVVFDRLGDEATRVTVHLHWEPTSLVERAGAALHLDNRLVSTDLRQFKEYVEARGGMESEWRDEID